MLLRLRLAHVAIIAATAAFLLSAGGARAATVETWTGPDYFGNASITFAPVTANSLTLISNLVVNGISRDAYFHNLDHDRTFYIQVLIGADWITIYERRVLANDTAGHAILLKSLLPIMFPEAEIRGLAFRTNTNMANAYFNMFRSEFTFDLVTPLPAALPLFGFGLGLLGLLSLWRKRGLAQSAVDSCPPLAS